ncbi:MAG: hypothetical protein BGO69_08665 [Bacteroidetes bacterium 46-16]|nr:MAG: hypothetical protein BGO69_08665 [Bacteroidetes bacterium 46-16]
MKDTHLYAVIIITVIAFIILLFVYQAKRQTKKRQADMLDILSKINNNYGLNPDKQEVYQNKILALDSQRKFFVFVGKSEDVQGEAIELDNVVECKIKKLTTRVSRLRKGKEQEIEESIRKVQLSFLNKDRSETDVTIYSEIGDGLFELQELTKVAEKWQGMIKEVMNVRFTG